MPNQSNTSPSNQREGGRPKDSASKKKKFLAIARTAFINEVAAKHKAKKESANGRMRKGRFDELVSEICILREIDGSATVSKATIGRRIERSNLALSSALGGKPSPLAPCEDRFADMTIKLSRCRHSIASGEGLQLINSLIKNTEIELAMKQWKLANAHAYEVDDVDGAVGCRHWKGFMRQQGHRIASKRGQKYELGR